MAFTEADRRKLEALKEKERKSKQAERNEQKQADRLCKKLFGLTVKQVKDGLEKQTPANDYWNEYHELKTQIERLMDALPHRPESFESYVQFYEKKRLKEDHRRTQICDRMK